MTRWTSITLLLVLLSLAGVAVGVIWKGQRDRSDLAEQFAKERLQQIDEIAREIEEDFKDVSQDLYFAGQLAQAADNIADRERELRALLAVVKQYRLIEVYNSDAQPTLSIPDPMPGPPFSRVGLSAAITDTIQDVLLLAPGQLTIASSLNGDPYGWICLFAMVLPSGDAGESSRAVAVAVDTQSFFNKLRIITSKAVLLGSSGQPLPVTDAALATQLGSASVPQFSLLIERMRAGERGVMRINEADAEALGLHREEFVAAYTPIRIAGGHWAATTFSSTEVLRAQERAIVLRLGVAALVILLYLLLFGVYVVIASRRAVAVQERLRHAEQLAYLHEKTEKILDNIPTGVMALSAEGRITAINQALQRRIPTASLGAQLEDAFVKASPSTIQRLRALVEGALRTRSVQSAFGEHLQLFGEVGQYNLHLVPLESRFPDARVLLVVEDLSELRSLESQLLRAEKLATVGILAAGIAHEIGTPLSVIRGRAEYALEKFGEHPQASGLTVIIEQIDRVTRTIRQLLDFSRVQPAPAKPTALEPVVSAVIELLRIETKRRKLLLSHQIDSGLPLLSANPDQLQQVLVNLVMNACDACVEGGKVQLSAQRVGAYVKIEVVDNGVGIIPEHRHQIFDPFFTTKKRGQGTGLGLTIASQIVRNHNGEIEVTSEPARGTRATLRWPISNAANTGAT